MVKKICKNIERESPIYRYLATKGRLADFLVPSHSDFSIGCLEDPATNGTKMIFCRERRGSRGARGGARWWSPRSLDHHTACGQRSKMIR